MQDYQKLGNKFNFDDVYFRNVLVAFITQFRNQIRWKNHFSDEIKESELKVYYSMTGNPKFVYDAFIDDPVACRLELNYEHLPYMIVTMSGWNIKSNEQTNPNVRVRFIEENDDRTELKSFYAKLKAMPITINYTLTAIVNTELDMFKFNEAMIKWFYKYKFFTFMFNHIKIDAFFSLPDNFEVQINNELSATDKRIVKVGINFDVDTYLPIIDDDVFDARYANYTNNGAQGDATGFSDPRTNVYSDMNRQTNYSTNPRLGADKTLVSILHNIRNNNLDPDSNIIQQQYIPDLEEDNINLDEILKIENKIDEDLSSKPPSDEDETLDLN